MKEQELLSQEDATLRHSEIPNYRYEECVKAKDRYVRVYYMNRDVDNLTTVMKLINLN